MKCKIIRPVVKKKVFGVEINKFDFFYTPKKYFIYYF